MKTALLLLIAAIAFAISPFLNPEFGGFDPNRYPLPQIDPPVQPAGYAFAIWGPIYLWLLVSTVFGLWRRAHAPDWVAFRLPLVVSLAVGAAWLPVALIAPIPATVMIWVMLIGAVVAMLRAPVLDHWWVAAPVGLYAGWLTAASFVALGLSLAGYGLMSETTAAYVCLVGALVFAIAVLMRRGVATYGAAVVWALIAVAVQNWGAFDRLVILALASAAVVAAVTLWQMQKK